MKTKKFQIGLIGCGALGSSLKKMIQKDRQMELVFVFDELAKRSTVKTLEEGLEKGVDLVVEAASMEAVQVHVQTILAFADLLVLSSSAFANKATENAAKNACKKYGHKVFVPAGAISGLDGISAVKNEIIHAQIVTTKNPKGFGRFDKKKTVLFEGNARAACRLFPKNVNVAATLSLYGIGFEKTKVKIVSDPAAKENTHEISVEGKFGRFFVCVQNTPSRNPKTSALAAKTTFELIKNIRGAQAVFG